MESKKTTHHHEHHHGDFYSYFATGTQSLIDALNCYYYLSELVALFDGSEEDKSLLANSIGIIGAGFALCSMYANYKVYKHHQVHSDETHLHEESTLLETSALPKSGSDEPLLSDEKKKTGRLKTLLKKSSVGMVRITSSIGIAGKIAAPINELWNPNLLGKIGIHGSALLFGTVTAKAKARNCEHAIQAEQSDSDSIIESKKSESHHHTHGDHYSQLATVTQGVFDALDCYYYLAKTAAMIMSSDNVNSPFSISLGALGASSALLSMYAHYKLYVYHEASSHQTPGIELDDSKNSPDLESSKKSESLISASNKNKLNALNLFQHINLALDWFSHSVDVAGEIAAPIHELWEHRLNLWGKICVQLGALGIGVISGTAEVRNCRHAMQASPENQKTASLK